MNFFLAEQQALIHSWKYTNHQELEDFPRINLSVSKTRCTTHFPPYDALYTEQFSCKPPEAKHKDSVNLVGSGMISAEAVVEVKKSRPSTTEWEIYYYLQWIWEQEAMSCLKNFLPQCNNKDVVVTLETRQNMNVFQSNLNISSLNLVLPCPTETKILYKSRDAKLYPCPEGDEDLLQMIGQDMVGDRYMVFTHEAVLDRVSFLE